MKQEVAVKDNLKRIVQEQLGKSASALFLEKSLAIIDTSADNKESFMAAAVRISKRIALFIDRDLAQTVYESLMVAIEKITSPQGTRRRYARVTFCKKVLVRFDGVNYELDSESLSEGGMYIRTKEPFPVGSEMEITLPLEVGSRVCVTGCVVYKRDPFGDTSKLPLGMAIEFKKVVGQETEILRSFIQRALTQDVLETRGESASGSLSLS